MVRMKRNFSKPLLERKPSLPPQVDPSPVPLDWVIIKKMRTTEENICKTESTVVILIDEPVKKAGENT